MGVLIQRHGLMLSRPVDLLFAIVEIHLPTSRTVIGGIQKLSSDFNFSTHRLLNKVEQTKLSVVHPLDWARVSDNVKKCVLNKLGDMGGVVLFVFLLDLFVISLMAFYIMEVLLSVSTSLSKYAFLAERTKLFTLFLCFLKSSNFFSFLRRSRIAIAPIKERESVL